MDILAGGTVPGAAETNAITVKYKIALFMLIGRNTNAKGSNLSGYSGVLPGRG